MFYALATHEDVASATPTTCKRGERIEIHTHMDSINE